VSPLYL